MLQVERNKPIDTEVLVEFFGRCGCREAAGALALEWAMAAAEEWVACKLNGELIGFARSCRLGPSHRIVFDALVDPRFKHTGLRAMIVRLLAATASDLEQVSVFDEKRECPSTVPRAVANEFSPLYAPLAPPDAYLGKPRP